VTSPFNGFITLLTLFTLVTITAAPLALTEIIIRPENHLAHPASKPGMLSAFTHNSCRGHDKDCEMHLNGSLILQPSKSTTCSICPIFGVTILVPATTKIMKALRR